MEWIANLVYWVFATCVVAGFGTIAFLWERMRRDSNLVLPAEQRISIYPSSPGSLLGRILWPNRVGHFFEVLDKYQGIYPHSSLPKKLALGLLAWILCFMGLIASGAGQ